MSVKEGNPGEPEVYYFDERVREAVIVKQGAIKEPAPVKKKASKRTTKKG